jgi:hypothetical protein
MCKLVATSNGTYKHPASINFVDLFMNNSNTANRKVSGKQSLKKK